MALFNLISIIKNKICKSNLAKGTLILTCTGIITRIIGFINRVFLIKIIGAKELGIFQTVLPIYMIGFSLSTLGNETTVTKLVSQNRKNAKIIMKISLILSFISACSIMIFILLFQNEITEFVLKNKLCNSSLAIISFGIPFMAIKGTFHGYFIGKENSSVIGISNLIEQTAKTVFIMILGYYSVFYITKDASLASLGVVAGEILSTMYTVIYYLISENKTKQEADYRKQKVSYLKQFTKDSIPITLNKTAITILQSIEAILIPITLLQYHHDSTISLSIYGSLQGIAFPFVLVPATLTNSYSTMLLPIVSKNSNEESRHTLKQICSRSIMFCFLIGIISTIFFYLFGPIIGTKCFSSRIAGILIKQLSLLCPFIFISTTMTNILNGLGLSLYNLFQTSIVSFIRIILIIYLIPKIGINGYIYSLLISYFILTFISCYRVNKKIR